MTEAVLACGFLPDQLREALGEGEHAGVALTYVVEPDRRGTAGAIRFAAESLGDRLDDRFLALNGDVLTDLDLTALLRAHEERGARATIGLYPVEDSSAYGLVECDADGRRARLHREDRRGGAGGDQRGRLRAGALGARPDPGRARSSRSSARSSRGSSATGLCALPSRWVLDGHRHPGAISAGDLGHPRGEGGDGRAPDRAGALRRRRLRGRATRRGSARGRWSRPGCAVGRRGDGRCARCCSPAARSARGRRVSGSILGAGADGRRPAREVLDAMVAENERVARRVDDRRRPRHPRPTSRRALADRIGAARGGALGGLFVCGMGGSAIGGDLAAAALGDRLTGPMADRPRLRAAELGDAGVDGALLELLGRDRGDARLLRGRRGARRQPPGRQHRRPAGRPGPRRPACRWSACRGSSSRAPRSPTWSSSPPRPPALAGVAPRVHTEIDAAAAFLTEQAETLAAAGARDRRADRRRRAGHLRLRPDRAGGAPLEDAGQRERQAPGLVGRAAGGRPQRAARLVGRGGRRASGGDLPRGPRPAPAGRRAASS